MVFLFAVVISKLLPPSRNALISFIQNDWLFPSLTLFYFLLFLFQAITPRSPFYFLSSICMRFLDLDKQRSSFNFSSAFLAARNSTCLFLFSLVQAFRPRWHFYLLSSFCMRFLDLDKQSILKLQFFQCLLRWLSQWLTGCH